MQPVSYVIWFAVLGAMGALNSAALYTINALAARRADAEE
jgi:hypothetical protein